MLSLFPDAREAGPAPPGGPHWRAPVAAAAMAASVLTAAGSAAQSPTPWVLQGGPPVQVRPRYPEPGLPLITVDPGTPNPFAGIDGQPGGGGASGGSTAEDGTAGGVGTTNASGGHGDPLTTMLGTSWGIKAVNAADSLGVNASAVAATCVLESGCRNQPANGGAEGVFQMYPAAFQEGLRTALQANPALASQVVQGDAGRFDPVTSAIAASGYLMQAAQTLQQAGVTNPTVLDVRGNYNFGPRYAVDLAQAPANTPMGQVLTGAGATVFSGNGITPSTTVGEWRASVAAKIGNAARQPVRMG